MKISYVDEHMRETMLVLQLVPYVVMPPKIEAYYLRRPDGRRCGSSLILFTPEGIVIMGDLCPGRDGVISTLGYGRDWFAGELSENYLCEKFMRREWVAEQGERQLRDEILEARRDESITKDVAREAWDAIERALWDGELDSRTAYEIHQAADLGDFEIGMGYNPTDAGWLCAIQQRFAELYGAQLQERVA